MVADKTVAERGPQRIAGLRTGSEQRLWVRLLTISLVMSSPIIAAALSGAGIWLLRFAILFGLGLGIALLVYLTLPSDATGVGRLRLGDPPVRHPQVPLANPSFVLAPGIRPEGRKRADSPSLARPVPARGPFGSSRFAASVLRARPCGVGRSSA